MKKLTKHLIMDSKMQTGIILSMLFAIIIIVLNSCVYDCLNIHQGHVIDKKTNEPINEVNVLVMFKDTILNNYGFKYDTIPIKQRLDLIKKYGNKVGWWNPQDNKNKMAVSAPLFSDSLGYYEIKFMTGKYPTDLKLVFLKAGYVPYIYKPDNVVDSLVIRLDKIEK